MGDKQIVQNADQNEWLSPLIKAVPYTINIPFFTYYIIVIMIYHPANTMYTQLIVILEEIKHYLFCTQFVVNFDQVTLLQHRIQS